MSSKEEILGRIVLVGETQVGKTCIVQRYLRGQCSSEQKSTVGTVFHTSEKEIDGKLLSLQIWDTAGQERYKALGPVYYRKANAAIAVFDVTRKETLYALGDWIKAFRENADDTYVVIAANKCDLEEEKQVTLEDGIEYASKYNADCIMTSAFTGYGIEDVFENISRHLIEVAAKSKQTDDNNNSKIVELNQSNSKPKKGCC